jgi:hypothetical protein
MELEDGSIGMTLTDIPYPTTERFRAIGTTTRTKKSGASSNPWYGVLTIAQLAHFLGLLYQKHKNNTYAFIYCDRDTELLLQVELGVARRLREIVDQKRATSEAIRDDIGWGWRNGTDWFEVPGGEADSDEGPSFARWVKTTLDGTKERPGTGYHGVRCTETLLCLTKGKPKPRKRWNNALFAPRPALPKEVEAASPKPYDIAVELVRAGSDAGDLVVDPFVGCGVHALAIHHEGRLAVVNDIQLGSFRTHLRLARTAFQEV